MRQVNIFTIKKPRDNITSIETIYKAFGDNIPQMCPLEGWGAQYLCCVDISVDFEGICEKYEYQYYPAYKFEVDDAMYNSEYQIKHNYCNKDQPYKLEKESK